MNCLEFRRLILADPRRLGAEAAEHAGQCAGCKEFHARALDEEALLAGALRVAVPEGLHARILDRTAAARRRVRWLALAASVVFAVAIALAVGWTRNDELALAGINFVVFEEAQSIADATPTDWKALVRLAREMDVSLPDQLGEMQYICVYPFSAGAAHHLLVKTPLGKVTLLLIPDRAVGARAAGAAYGLNAAVLPGAKGTILIIGDSPRSVQRAEMLLALKAAIYNQRRTAFLYAAYSEGKREARYRSSRGMTTNDMTAIEARSAMTIHKLFSHRAKPSWKSEKER